MRGHSATQEPSWTKGVLDDVQLTQSVLEGPLHVPHAPSHGTHTLLLLAYLATGVHEARHEPGASKNGYDEAHVVHSVDEGPEHVPHDVWHVVHVSADEPLPPEHVEPASMAHSALHPSKLRRLPSSHASVPARRPSPQTVTQSSLALRLPPLHVYPASMVQFTLHPSPLIVLLSSHSSDGIHVIRRPSPHMGAQVSSPPMPEPPATSVVDTHSNPVSI